MKMNEMNCLELAYQKLHGTIILKNKKVKNGSLLITFLDLKSNDRLRILSESTIKSSDLPLNEKQILMSKGLLFETDKVNSICISAKGIFLYEKEKNKINDNTLINYIDHKYFNLFEKTKKDLSEKEKIILMSLIALRSFSRDSSLYLKKSETVQNKLGEIYVNSYHFLKRVGVIERLKENELFGKKGLEHPVSNVFRHTDNLPKMTKAIFCAPGNQKYYLELYKNETFDKNKLKFLFQKIFSKIKMDYSLVKDICDFLNDISYTMDVYFFDHKKHIFSNTDYDNIIREVLLEI